MTEELRLYTFTNFMLSSIQQGIQSGHAAVELAMCCYYEQMVLRQGTKWDIYHEWASRWKTMVCLNGGNAQELKELDFFLSNLDNKYPWCVFYESHDALDGTLTSVAIILPARIFETVAALRKKLPGVPEYLFPEDFNNWEIELINRLVSSSLAR